MSSKVMSKLIRTVRMMSFENLGPGVCSFPKSLKKIPILVALLGFGALVGRERTISTWLDAGKLVKRKPNR